MDSKFFTQKVKSRQFSNCIDLVSNPSKEFIKVDGYYEAEFMDSVMYNVSYGTKFKWDTVRYYYIFYRNKLVAVDIYPIEFSDKKWSYQKKNRKNIENYLKKVQTDSKYASRFYNDVWGIVRINGDTLHIQSQYNSTWRHNINAEESYWKISNHYLTSLGGRALGPPRHYPIRWKSNASKIKLRFIPFEDIPPSNGSWIYNQKWAWCK